MEELRRQFRWMKNPQLFVGFIVLCLCIAAVGNVFRATALHTNLTPKNLAKVKGAHTQPELVSPDCAALPCIALSFDDGPNPLVTPRVLDILAAEHIHATFFLIGSRIPGNEPLVRRMYREGNEIGNHSWNHADFTKLSPAEMDAQLRQTQTTIVNAGIPAPRLFRPPYGAVNDTVISHTHMTIARWDIDPEDWLVQDAAKVDQNLLAHAKPGGIIIMHDIYPSTADALEPAIQALKPHYQFVTISQLMHLTPGDQGQYFGR